MGCLANKCNNYLCAFIRFETKGGSPYPINTSLNQVVPAGPGSPVVLSKTNSIAGAGGTNTPRKAVVDEDFYYDRKRFVDSVMGYGNQFT